MTNCVTDPINLAIEARPSHFAKADLDDKQTVWYVGCNN